MSGLIAIVWIGVVLTISVVIDFGSRLKEGALALALLVAGASIFLGSGTLETSEVATELYFAIGSAIISALSVYLVLKK